MRHLHATPLMRRGVPMFLAPVAGVMAIAAAAVLTVLAIATLGLALLWPGARRRIRFGFPGPRGQVRGATGTPDRADVPHGAKRPEKPRSHAEVIDLWPFVLAATLLSPALAHAKLLVPMDDAQAQHLKAYGLTYWVLQRGQKCEWLLNYRGGSFLLPDDAAIAREANIRGVTSSPISGAEDRRSARSCRTRTWNP